MPKLHSVFPAACLFLAGALFAFGACALGQGKNVVYPPSYPNDSETAPPDTIPASPYTWWLEPAPPGMLPIWADSNSPLFWSGDTFILFMSPGSGGTVRFVFDAQGVLVDMQDIFWLNPEEPRFRWIEAIWHDEENSMLYAWYHWESFDPHCAYGTAPKIGAAISYDGGFTWQDHGVVLESAYPPDCSWDNGYFTGGNGDFSVILDPQKEFFYFFFSHYGGPLAEQGIALARSAFADRGQPGTVYKYHLGAWDEAGIGGEATPLFPAASSWEGPETDAMWGPSVHWNTEINHYVMVMNRVLGAEWMPEGIYIAFSKDAVNWSAPQKLISTNGWYPEIIGLGAGETDRLVGAVGRLYIHGHSSLFIHFRNTKQ